MDIAWAGEITKQAVQQAEVCPAHGAIHWLIYWLGAPFVLGLIFWGLKKKGVKLDDIVFVKWIKGKGKPKS